MIGLGLTKQQAEEAANTDVGMLDVSANALAVLILATMLVLTVAAPPALRGEVRASDQPELFYPSPLEVVIAPQSAYWIVTEAGLTRLDLNAFSAALAEGRTVGRTPQGEATLIIDRRNYRDLNDHRLIIAMDWDAIRQAAVPIATADVVGIEGDAIGAAFADDNIAPTFVVTQAGTAAFAQLYWHLRAAQTPMRWVSLVEGGNLTLSRRVQNFEMREIRWQ